MRAGQARDAERKIWDPLRRKEVARTPEEEVRQWLIRRLLHEGMGVPMHMMMSEVSLQLGEKPFRADVVVYAPDLSPVLVAECKRPDVALGGETLRQSLQYNMVLGVRWVMVSNGRETFVFSVGPDGLHPQDSLPSYGTLTGRPETQAGKGTESQETSNGKA